jgi:glycosyltransferase involved in cell wall biosynthesis
MDKITFCIPSKSNVRYLKTCIPSIRKHAYRDDHDIIIFVDSDEDGTVEWLEEVKDKYNIKYYINPDLGEKLYGIGKAYDFCIEKSTTDIFMIFHADMMLGRDADLKAFNHLKPKTVVCSTRVEPPIHPNGGEKILEDFGMWPEEFQELEFDNYVNQYINETKTTEGIFAPWMMYKDEFLAIGGHDPIMHSCREDSDVFNRMLLDGFNFIQPWNSLVYHLTGRGAGSFDGDPERHEKWKADMNKSTLEFIRKWGQNVNHTPLMKPLIAPKYDIGYIIKNCNLNLLKAIEPWGNTVYVDCDYKDFIENEQPNTSFDLFERIKPYDNEKNNEILIELDGKLVDQQNFSYIQQMSLILEENGVENNSKFELGIFKISTSNINTYEKQLIKLKPNQLNEENYFDWHES